MPSDTEVINHLVRMLKSGELEGDIEITLKSRGHKGRITIRRKGSEEEKSDVEKSIRKVQLERPSLANADFSGIDLTGSDFSGLDLKQSDFSGAEIKESDFSGAELEGAEFYRARISQSDFSYSRGVDIKKADVTGSVNLYGANEPAGAAGMKDVYRQAADTPGEYRRYDYDQKMEDMGRGGGNDHYGGY
ncbi:MAG: pentapeptide repeat-containing protein [Candidatus Woesearchaeota archaeon]